MYIFPNKTHRNNCKHSFISTGENNENQTSEQGKRQFDLQQQPPSAEEYINTCIIYDNVTTIVLFLFFHLNVLMMN